MNGTVKELLHIIMQSYCKREAQLSLGKADRTSVSKDQQM